VLVVTEREFEVSLQKGLEDNMKARKQKGVGYMNMIVLTSIGTVASNGLSDLLRGSLHSVVRHTLLAHGV